MKNLKKRIIKTLKRHVPHVVYSAMSMYSVVPEKYPPSFTLDKVGSKRKSFAVRSMDMTNIRGINYVDVDVPQYEYMHGYDYKKKHKARLERDWGRLF